MYCHVCLCNTFVIEDMQRSSMHMVWDNILSALKSGHKWSGTRLDNGLKLVWNSSQLGA